MPVHTSDLFFCDYFHWVYACKQSCLSHLPCQYTGLLSPPVKQQMQQQQQCWDYSFSTSSGWPKFTYVTNPVTPETRCMTYILYPQGRSCFCFFLYFYTTWDWTYTSGTLHAGHFCTHFQLWGRPFHSSLLAFFFLPSSWCCYEKNSFHTASFSCFISLVCSAHHLFLSSRGQLLDSHKHWLFCLYIQQATHCLFEQRTLVSSSETAVCGFYLSNFTTVYLKDQGFKCSLQTTEDLKDFISHETAATPVMSLHEVSGGTAYGENYLDDIIFKVQWKQRVKYPSFL